MLDVQVTVVLFFTTLVKIDTRDTVFSIKDHLLPLTTVVLDTLERPLSITAGEACSTDSIVETLVDVDTLVLMKIECISFFTESFDYTSALPWFVAFIANTLTMVTAFVIEADFVVSAEMLFSLALVYIDTLSID